ncbi:chaplin [Streptomyces sp. NPDC005813]|uniref:chaplin n=1 Tax=Streptomyces sp. NPDC005813 TaxID=3155592 RepID=UPI0033C897FC
MSRIAKATVVAMGTGAVMLSGAGLAMADAGAAGEAVRSPGAVSGNAVQAPINVPVNLCGDTVDVIGLLNPAFGNHCGNVDNHEGGDDHEDGGYGDDGGYGN